LPDSAARLNQAASLTLRAEPFGPDDVLGHLAMRPSISGTCLCKSTGLVRPSPELACENILVPSIEFAEGRVPVIGSLRGALARGLRRW